MIKKMIKLPRSNQGGFILITVLMMISLIAAVAYFTNRNSTFSANQSRLNFDRQRIKYAAEAGLIITESDLQSNASCSGYSIAPNGEFNGYTYTTSLSDTSGSPVTIQVDMDLGSGKTQSFSRTVNKFGAKDIELPVVQDSYSTGANNKSTNYGNETSLHVKPSTDRRTYLQFDLSGFTENTESIVAAKLNLHQSSAPEVNTLTINAFRVKKEWVEDEVTNDERKAGKSWLLIGPINFDFDVFSPSSTVVDENIVGWKEWDITSVAVGWLNGTHTNYGVALSSSSGSPNNIEFFSRESADSSKHPKLVISTQCECGSAGCT